ncbi:uncharacterized protein LOC117301867 [Asterias rubens]|uniref:CrAMP-2 n=1 Tax=Asterias rubens TaxID=7604 RepID=A0A386GVB2_ASTRU|nr:uncharacterized protein LOC117301867 [Asterias rubens]AYD37770.1 CrAMP-2 precursor [Asterias rubens]
MASKIFLAVMALAVLTAFVFAEEEEYAVDDLMEFVKRGKGRNRGRGKMGPLTKDDMETCDRYGQQCVCDKRLSFDNNNRYLVCN